MGVKSQCIECIVCPGFPHSSLFLRDGLLQLENKRVGIIAPGQVRLQPGRIDQAVDSVHPQVYPEKANSRTALKPKCTKTA